ncbi:hypothetical protein OKW26_005005 [Paraburkholderia sp. 32]
MHGKSRVCGSFNWQCSLIRYALPMAIVLIKAVGLIGRRRSVGRFLRLTATALQSKWSRARRTQVPRVAGVAAVAGRVSGGVQKAAANRAKPFEAERRSRFARVNSRTMRAAMIESFVTGLLAWRDGQPGQVGNEAATAVFHQCRGSGSSPFLAFFSAAVLTASAQFLLSHSQLLY